MSATYDVQYVGDAVLGPDKKRWSLHMKDLVRETGLQRQAIHFYIKEGLVPPGIKSSRNMAWYGAHHLERLKLIRMLQHERFLPLKAIKAAFAEGQGDPRQQAFIRDVRRHIVGRLRMPARVASRPLEEALAETKANLGDVEELADMGIISIVHKDDYAHVALTDLWALELVAQLRALGFTESAGFAVRDLAIYEDAVNDMFAAETALLHKRLEKFAPPVVARMVERMVPLIHTFIERSHEAKIRNFLALTE